MTIIDHAAIYDYANEKLEISEKNEKSSQPWQKISLISISKNISTLKPLHCKVIWEA